MLVRPSALPIALLSLTLLAGAASAVEVPFLEDFPADAEAWRNSQQGDLEWLAAGGPDGGSHVTTELSYFGFTSPFGGGLVVLRANDSVDASGDAFVGDWVAGGVDRVSAWVRQDTGEELTYFLRLATSTNFPGVVFDDDVAVPSGAWTQIVVEIDEEDCQLEGVPACGDVLENVGNFQIGTIPPESLTLLEAAFTHDLDKVELAVPEPGRPALLLATALALVALPRLRR